MSPTIYVFHEGQFLGPPYDETSVYPPEGEYVRAEECQNLPHLKESVVEAITDEVFGLFQNDPEYSGFPTRGTIKALVEQGTEKIMPETVGTYLEVSTECGRES